MTGYARDVRGDDPLCWSPDALSALLRRLPGPVATEDLAPLTELLLAWVPYTCRVRDVAPVTLRQMVPALQARTRTFLDTLDDRKNLPDMEPR